MHLLSLNKVTSIAILGELTTIFMNQLFYHDLFTYNCQMSVLKVFLVLRKNLLLV